MASNKTKTPAQAARAAARQFKQPGLLKLDTPTFSSKNPLLPDTADDEPNQLHKDLRGKDLTIDINQFDEGGAGRSVVLKLFLNGENVVETPILTTPIRFPVELEVPGRSIALQGGYTLDYEVNIQGNETSSDTLFFNIDTTPPNGDRPGAAVTLPADVEREGITREYLDANGGKVQVTVPGDYFDAKIDDKVVLKFGTSLPLAVEVDTFPRTNLADPIVLELEQADIKQSGLHSFWYTLIDRKGNQGPTSADKVVLVSLTPAPSGLLPPQVPLADDGLIDYADVVEGVKVHIQPYTNWFANDLVIVTFDGTDHAPQQMPQNGASVSLPYSLIFSGDPGLKSSKVTYRIERNGRPYPELTGVDFEVDLRVPGPNPEDPPGSVHPGLTIPTIKGAVSTTDNVLTLEDADQDVTATALIYNNFAPGEYAQLYWNGVEVPGPGGRYDVQGSEASGFKMPFVIPWDSVREAGNGRAIPVHYIVGHALNDNIYHSAAQPVDVSGVEIVLAEPQFLNLDPRFNVLNCPSLRVHEGALVAEIEVPGDDRLASKKLTFFYQGWSDALGTVPIADTDTSFEYTPSQAEAENGFVVRLPYLGALARTLQDYGSIHFTVLLEGETTEATSERHLVDVEVRRPGGLACELP
ncbi:hypothetical protein [Pseudomonas shirazensis]|uniref:hypothetical protein n=1 Tax=Pseudomonas shirazensis TaxID=2745494 RepID=UPI003D2DD932